MRRNHWRRRLWRWRYVLAASLLALATLLALQELRPPAPPGHPVLVAVVDLPAGHEIAPHEVALEQRTGAPAGVLTVDQAVGSRTAVAVPAGLALVDSLVAGPGLASSAPRGTVVVPVHVADPAVLTLLRPGDRVDLYQAPVDAGTLERDADLIAPGALVLALPTAREAGGGLLGTRVDTADSSLIIAAIDAEHASVLTGAAGVAPFRVVLAPA